MNKIYNIVKYAGRGSVAKALSLFTMLLFTSGVEAADYGFKGDCCGDYVWQVQIGYNGDNWKQHGSIKGYSGDANLGIVTTDVYLDSYYGWCWGSSHDLRLLRKVKYNNDPWPSDYTEEWNQHWDDDGDKKIESSPNVRLFEYSTSSPGDYQYRYYLRIDGSGYRDEDNGYCSNNGHDMWVKFTYPGFIGGSTSINVGNVKRGSSGTASLANTYAHYGTALTTSKCTISGTHASMFRVTSISESNVTVLFEPPLGTALGTKTATLTIKDAHNKTKTISLSGTAQYENDPIVLIADTAHIADGPTVTLQGYLKQTGCATDINRFGFKYAASCAGVESGTDTYMTSSTPMKQGSVFSKTITSGLTEGTTYYYKAYVYSPTVGYIYSADCETFTTRKGCTYASGDTIYYTINGSVDENDDCALVYKTFEAALTNLRSRTSGETNWYDSTDKLLKKHIVFQVAPGTYGTSGSWIDFSQINYYNNSKSTSATRYFIIRPLKKNTKPIVYGMKLADSRWVTVDGMNIKRDNTTKGLDYSAILVGRDVETNNLTVGSRSGSDWRIKFVNCEIEGKNFCSIHANGIDGFYMENCNLVAGGADTRDTYNWGASIKLMNSKNIVMMRNNFKGAHANNIFAQNVRNMLVMNNVFWNDNAVTTVGQGWATPNNEKAIIRLINYGASDNDHKVQNIGMYYNTMYIAENTATGYNEPVNFLCFGGKAPGSPYQDKTFTYYDFNTIDFMYNNCYSYDSGIAGRPESGDTAFGDEADKSSSTHLANNNFWSQYDTDHSSSKSGFAFGSGCDFVNVKDQVCKTTANTPEGLVVKGTGLNRGSHLTADVASATYAGSSINATTIYDDRLKFEIRPRNSDPWTLGAYQQALPHTIDVIIWNGGENEVWDNRNNWIKPNGQLVTCTDILDDNLQVIIPSPNSEQYPLPSSGSITRYPSIPVWDDEDIPEEGIRIGSPAANKYASNIELEYGASIKGVENLASGSPIRYVEATSYYTAGRNEWILVGNVIMPFTNDTKTTTRNINSGDYFIAGQEPHVYMQHVEQNGTNVKNGTPFTSLEQAVSGQSTYMIKIPDQYGPYKLPASIYYSKKVPDKSKLGDGTEPKTFTFNGRFAADTGLPSYTGLVNDDSKFNFVNNYYPANLDIYGVLGDYSGWNAKYYNYSNQSWTAVATSGILIKPQAGFILVGTGATTVTPAANRYITGNTAYKSAGADDLVQLSVFNTFDNSGSTVFIKSEGINSDKAFGWNANTPEMYIPSDGSKYDLYIAPVDGGRIPLGIRNSSGGKITVKFVLEKMTGYDEVILEDAKENMTYDLTEEQPIFNGIPTGDFEGRFFLNIESGLEPITSVDEVDASETASDTENSISVFAYQGRLTVATDQNSVIESIVVSDMSGRNWSLQPNGSNYSVHYMNVAPGVYTVSVVTNNGKRMVKVIIK